MALDRAGARNFRQALADANLDKPFPVPTQHVRPGPFLVQLQQHTGLFRENSVQAPIINIPGVDEESEVENEDESNNDFVLHRGTPSAGMADVAGPDPDFDAGDTEEDDPRWPPASIWLDQLTHDTWNFHSAGPAKQPAEMLVTLHDYQLYGLQAIANRRESAFKSILIADGPGLGKTAQAIGSVVQTAGTGGGPVLIVVVSSCRQQWLRELFTVVAPGHLKIYNMTSNNIPPEDLLQYDVVLTTYTQVMRQHRARQIYFNAMVDLTAGSAHHVTDLRHSQLPKKPATPLYSGLFARANRVFKTLILDEVTVVRNTKTQTFRAIKALQYQTLIAMSGTFIENKFEDVYAILALMPGGHTIDSLDKFRALYGSQTRPADATISQAAQYGPPKGARTWNLRRLLNAFTIRRPESMLVLPPLKEQVHHFSLDQTEAMLVTEVMARYKRLVAKMNSHHYRMVRGDTQRVMALMSTASRHAFHPALLEHKNNPTGSLNMLEINDDVHMGLSWLEKLRTNEGYRSSRVDALTNLVAEIQTYYRDDKIMVFSETTLGLDICAIALQTIGCTIYRYDGRMNMTVRDVSKTSFENATGKAVMLISRGAGGVGLNFPAANHVILVEPWWCRAWEIQAIKRCHRQGQSKTVNVYRLVGQNSEADTHKREKCEEKAKINQILERGITLRPDCLPEHHIYRYLEE